MEHRHMMNGGLLSSIREVMFGLEDSLVSTLGVVVGVAAGTNDRGIVLLTGIILVVVEALSMAAGSFLSSKAHREMIEQAIREEKWEIDNEPEKETEELQAMYRSRGFSDAEVEILVRRITSDKNLWLEEMMAKELKIGAVELEVPKKDAAVMFVSYVAGGIVPIAPFAFLPTTTASIVASVLTIVTLFAIGSAKSHFTSQNVVRGGLETVAVAGAAALIGYGIGKGASMYFGVALR